MLIGNINILWLIYHTLHVIIINLFHSPTNTVGIFWNNAAETWVDVTNSKDVNVVSSIVNLVSGQRQQSQVDTHFMSESGIIDFFVFLGPSPKDVVNQYAALTGVAPLPQVLKFFTFNLILFFENLFSLSL